MPPLQEAVIFCTLLYSTVVQHEVLANEDLMELEAQTKDKERQEEEVTEESKRLEMPRGLSLSEEALFVFEAKDSNVEWYMKVTAAIQNAVWCYHVIYDKRKRATTQTLGFPGGTVGKEPACQCSR